MGNSLRTRLYINSPLAAGQIAALTPEQVHYLRNVLRLSVGVELALFNGADGEWLGRIAELGKDKGQVEAITQRRPQSSVPDIWLLFAPIKRQGVDLIAEKATELGAAVIWPVVTKHTDVARVNTERMQLNAIEAAEQCERLDVPELREPKTLVDVLATWPKERLLIVAAESGEQRFSLPEVLKDLPKSPMALLVGPEGGFATSELELLARQPFVKLAHLGPRILRAETAALAVLAVWQALSGDAAR
jgi:16S rRNA (uracil1498-N3)-methyltransferase